ncbi:hypothetical protein F8R89_04745 [Streptomyces sp. SS1-1]|nr:hypothetical protein F8R89_04745 [Streptomyces sp. SS1-1]
MSAGLCASRASHRLCAAGGNGAGVAEGASSAGVVRPARAVSSSRACASLRWLRSLLARSVDRWSTSGRAVACVGVGVGAGRARAPPDPRAGVPDAGSAATGPAVSSPRAAGRAVPAGNSATGAPDPAVSSRGAARPDISRAPSPPDGRADRAGADRSGARSFGSTAGTVGPSLERATSNHCRATSSSAAEPRPPSPSRPEAAGAPTRLRGPVDEARVALKVPVSVSARS